MLARLQRSILVVLLLAAAGWLYGFWRYSPALAAAGSAAILLGHAFFLAVEFVWMHFANHTDPAPRATVRQVVAAWWQESLTSPRVFFWRQPFRADAVPDYLPPSGPAFSGSAPGVPNSPNLHGVPNASGLLNAPVEADRSGIRGVVLVHGLVCNRGFWTPWLQRLRASQRPFVALSLEPVFGLLDGYLPALDDAVRRVTAATGLAPILVCHSMGGLVARAWLRQAADDSRVHRVITIGTPHGGTALARFSRPGSSSMQMRLGGEWLQQLQREEPPARRERFICWYSNCDNIVFPASTATLPGACNCFVPGVSHVALATHPVVMEACLAEIARS